MVERLRSVTVNVKVDTSHSGTSSTFTLGEDDDFESVADLLERVRDFIARNLP